MRLLRGVTLLAVGVLFACRSAPTTRPRDCGGPLTPSVPPHHTLRHGSVDTAYVRSGLARLVFRVRSAGPTEPGRSIASPTVLLRDSLAGDRTPLGRIGNSTGVAILDSVPLRYTTARVFALGYVSRTFPVALRSGYTDTIDVLLGEDRICLYH
jgi:hypothetical protein